MAQRQLDEKLGLRARDEHRSRDGERNAIELLLAGEVRDRLAALAACDELFEARTRFFRQRPFGRSDDACAAKAGGVGKKQARFAGVDAARAQDFGDAQAASSASCESCSVWCSAERAAISSSSSPSTIRSILYRVRLMRWSVTLPCGKLYVRMRSERSPEPMRSLRVEAVFACCSRSCLSRMRAASTPSAFSRFLCWERESWHSTTMPVGRWVTRIADSVLLTC